MGIGPSRFGRLARGGHFAPVRFYVNRYRAVVWHYLASDLAEFADRHPELLTGRSPFPLRAAPEERTDRRPRSWRARRIEQLTGRAEDAWHRAAALAAVLAPVQLADAVPDPDERAYLRLLRPVLVSARPVAPAAREVIEALVVAEDPDEIEWYRHCLAAALQEARADRCPPRREEGPPRGVFPDTPVPDTPAAPPEPSGPHGLRRLLSWRGARRPEAATAGRRP